MRRYLAFFMCVIVCLSFAACSEQIENAAKNADNSKTDVTDNQPVDSSNEETESDTESDTVTKDPADSPDYFEFNEEGRIAGSIEDCEIVEVSFGDKTFTLKEYFDDPRSYYEYFESYYKDSVIEYEPYVGADENIGFCYYFEDKSQDESLFLTMCDFGFEYGCETVMPENLNLIDFSVNGIALGDGVENVFDTFGDPRGEYMSENDYYSFDNYVVSYDFEASNPNLGWARDTVSFHVIDGKVSKILCVTNMYF